MCRSVFYLGVMYGFTSVFKNSVSFELAYEYLHCNTLLAEWLPASVHSNPKLTVRQNIGRSKCNIHDTYRFRIFYNPIFYLKTLKYKGN